MTEKSADTAGAWAGWAIKYCPDVEPLRLGDRDAALYPAANQ